MTSRACYVGVAVLSAAISAPLIAQSHVLFVPSSSAPTLGPAGGLGAAGVHRPDEIAAVAPIPFVIYFTRPLLSVSTQWLFVGDIDGDGDAIEASVDAPGGRIDALLIKRYLSPTTIAGPRTTYLSKSETTGFGAGQLQDGDVFRYASQGALEFFVREPELQTALGTTDDIDLDAICQDTVGNLYLSLADTANVNGSPVDDGALLFIGVANITYDVAGNVTSMVNGSAQLLATEADVVTWIQNSGVRNIAGNVPDLSPATFDLSALEIDQNGGAFTPPRAALTLPNLLFSWNDDGADGAVISTANSGSVAYVNAVRMGSNLATSGTHLGLRPSATGVGGLEALAVAPLVPDSMFSLEIFPSHSVAAGDPLWSRQEVIEASPYGIVVFFLDSALNGGFPRIDLPGIGGSIYGAGNPIIMTAVVADVYGTATSSVLIPPSRLGLGITLAWQAFDLNALRFALPGAMDL